MTKLSVKEIEKAYELEGVTTEIPQDALSCFMFEIKENIEDLIAEMRAKGKYPTQVRHIDAETGDVVFSGGRSKKEDDTSRVDIDTGEVFFAEGSKERISPNPWNFVVVYENLDDGKYILEDPDFNSEATVDLVEGGEMRITTAWSGYEYTIIQKKEGGCMVYFDGPLNGLLKQQLLPTMTYEPYTLKGKFVSSKGEELTPYMEINDYCQLREQKNKSEKNEQDYYSDGWINRVFNNELHLFREWTPKQSKKTSFGKKASKESLERKKKLMRIRLNKLKTREKKSGVVFADDLAAAKISGKEKRTITPELARKLKREHE